VPGLGVVHAECAPPEFKQLALCVEVVETNTGQGPRASSVSDAFITSMERRRAEKRNTDLQALSGGNWHFKGRAKGTRR